MACQDSVEISVRDRLAAYERQFAENTVSIKSYSVAEDVWSISELPISYEDYRLFLREFSEDTELYYMQYGSIFLGGNNLSLLGVSGDKFQQLMGFAMEDDTVWIGRDALAEIESSAAFAGQFCSVRGDTLYLYGSAFPCRVLGEEVRSPSIIGFTSGAGNDIPAAECIFLPVGLVSQIQEPLFFQSTLEVGGKEYRQKAEQITGYLAEHNELYGYQVEDRRQVYLKNSRDFSNDIKLVGWIGRFALLLTAVGIIGIMLVHLDERKKDFAVSMVVGGTRRRLAAETAVEIFMLCLIGGIAALGISEIAAPMLSTSQYPVRLQGHSVGLLAVLVLCMTVGVCGVLLSCVKIKEPVVALKEAND